MRKFLVFLLILPWIALAQGERDQITWSRANTQVRHFIWLATETKADGAECLNQATVGSWGGGVDGPKAARIICSMGGTDTDGFIYGNAVIAVESWLPASPTTFTFNHIISVDLGVLTMHGYLETQCTGNGDVVSTSWTTGQDFDIVLPDAYAQWAHVYTTITIDTSTCEPGDVFWWKYKVCDSTGTPSTNCSNSDGGVFIDAALVTTRLNYTSKKTN